jgi:hypothetical protein
MPLSHALVCVSRASTQASLPNTGPGDAYYAVAVASAVLRSAPSSPHVGQIEFGATRRARQGWAGTATVEYDGDIWAIDLDMIDVFVSDTVGFFDEIAASDWTGQSRWQSEFAELTIEARDVQDDLVALDIRFWWSRGDELDNEREGQLIVRRDALPDFAHRLRELTGAKGKGRLSHG